MFLIRAAGLHPSSDTFTHRHHPSRTVRVDPHRTVFSTRVEDYKDMSQREGFCGWHDAELDRTKVSLSLVLTHSTVLHVPVLDTPHHKRFMYRYRYNGHDKP